MFVLKTDLPHIDDFVINSVNVATSIELLVVITNLLSNMVRKKRL